jgi:hypothetical protein
MAHFADSPAEGNAPYSGRFDGVHRPAGYGATQQDGHSLAYFNIA